MDVKSDAKTRFLEMYTLFKRDGILPNQNLIITESESELFELMTKLQETTAEPKEESKEESKEYVATPRQSARQPPKPQHKHYRTSNIAIGYHIGCLSDAQVYTDSIMAQQSILRINTFTKYIGEQVSMDWVYAWASEVKPAGSAGSYFQTLRGTDTHTHIVSNKVTDFICALKHYGSEKNPRKITTFSWYVNSGYAFHLQKLSQKLKVMFEKKSQNDDEAFLEGIMALVVICSIGLPLYKLIGDISDFMGKKKRYRFKGLDRKALVAITLRDLVTIDKINNELETEQLLEAYGGKEELFSSNVHVGSITLKALDTFVFQKMYSYPTKNEFQCILIRAKANIDQWYVDSQWYVDLRVKEQQEI